MLYLLSETSIHQTLISEASVGNFDVRIFNPLGKLEICSKVQTCGFDIMI